MTLTCRISDADFHNYEHLTAPHALALSAAGSGASVATTADLGRR
jgi:hypothetical protein